MKKSTVIIIILIIMIIISGTIIFAIVVHKRKKKKKINEQGNKREDRPEDRLSTPSPGTHMRFDKFKIINTPDFVLVLPYKN